MLRVACHWVYRGDQEDVVSILLGHAMKWPKINKLMTAVISVWEKNERFYGT
jgi:hypothetical protein